MVRRIAFWMAGLCVICLTVQAQQPQVSVAPFFGGRLAALSLTFDDGLEEHYTLLYPQLKARDLKATFAVIGSKVGSVMRSKQDRIDGTDGTPCVTWDMLREMAADGQEIASHGWEHKAVTRLDDSTLHNEIWRNDSAIIANIGQKPMTYVYPGNAKNDETLMTCEQGRVGSRTFQMSLGSKRTLQEVQEYVDMLIAQGKWGITMTHGILRGYDHFKDPQVLWGFLDDICAKQDQLWIAPLCDVTAYVKERDNCRLAVDTIADGLSVNVFMTLDPQLFRHELTLVIANPVVAAVQDGRQLPLISRDKTTLVNINPYGGTIQLMNKK
jgi:peptidoglycan/xylan/chitin deacetylase (PgdA/CDA1 family)